VIVPLERRVRTLLLAVDDSPHSLEAVRRVGEFIDDERMEISLLYIQVPVKFLWVDPDERRKIEIERRYKAEKIFAAVNAALARQGLISHRQLTADGDPAHQILRCAGEIGADLIVLGSRGAGRLGRILKRSVSRTVANQANCPVLIVRSSGNEDSREAA
jgi:nucleotide-binding universal stress UspA family protein